MACQEDARGSLQFALFLKEFRQMQPGRLAVAVQPILLVLVLRCIQRHRNIDGEVDGSVGLSGSVFEVVDLEDAFVIVKVQQLLVEHQGLVLLVQWQR